jgi:predicted TIM-barrel fold metal-dependent hydrolase
MTADHQNWLSLRTEEIIDPELPICDPHHHLWDRPDSRYMLDDVLADTTAGHNVVQTVFVDCSSAYRTEGPEALRPVGETEFVERVTAPTLGQTPTIAAGIVGHADLTLGAEVARVLEAHLEASPDRFRGIRHPTATAPGLSGYKNPPPHLLLDERFREGFAQLQRYDLSFDAWLYHPQVPELVDLARAFPETTIITDHIAGPLAIGPYAGRRQEAISEWRAGMRELATCPNVTVKVGGLGMVSGGFDWPERAIPPGSEELALAMAPYYLWCIETFDVDRCMFESNFPVDNRSYSYAIMWNAFKRLTADLSGQERAALFHDTAARVYRLGDG